MVEVKSINRFNAWSEKWSKPDQMDVFQYISFNIHPEDVLLLSHLFFPDFRELSGCIILSMNYDAGTFEEVFSKMDGVHEKVEKTMNHTHIYDLFANCTEDVEDSVFENIGRLLKMCWAAHFRERLPDKKIIVQYDNTNLEYGPTLTVFQR